MSAWFRIVALSVLCALVSGCGGPSSPTSSGGDGSTLFPAGTWVGTLSRPGAAPLAATWVATRGAATASLSSGSFAGPLTLTFGGMSVIAELTGNLAGSNTAPDGGYKFNFDIGMTAGAASAVPSCSIQSCCGGTTQDLHDSSTAITTAPFQVSYVGCRGFIDPPLPPGCSSPSCGPNSVTEATQLVLRKQ